jgi:hypothetical protein
VGLAWGSEAGRHLKGTSLDLCGRDRQLPPSDHRVAVPSVGPSTPVLRIYALFPVFVFERARTRQQPHLAAVDLRSVAPAVVVVIASLMPPVIPATRSTDRAGAPGAKATYRVRRPLPTPALAPRCPAASQSAYALSAVDKSGRVADRSIVRAVGWSPGTRLDIRERAGVIVVGPTPDGSHCIDDRGHLHLPLTVRRWCGIATGDRVLLAADHASGLLIVHPVAVLDVLLAHLHTSVTSGGAA